MTRTEPTELAISAIHEADLIILGPGSLYTSVLPNLLVPEITDAIAQASVEAVCLQHHDPTGETDCYKASTMSVLFLTTWLPIVEYVVINNESLSPELAARYANEGAYPVEVDVEALRALGCKPVVSPLLNGRELARHDPGKLAQIIMHILFKSRDE